MLETKDLSAGYGKKRIVLGDISFTANSGEILCLIGANGAGKTTLLRTLSAHLPPVAGAVYVDSEDISKKAPAELAKKLAVMFTERVFPEMLTCRDVVETGRYPYTGTLGILSDEDKAEVGAALSLVRAADIADERFCQISDGQRQKIMLARAVAQKPQILILDEPTSFLDIKARLEFFRMIRELARGGMTIIISMHEIEYALRLADRLICIKNNTIHRMGTPEEIFRDGYISELYSLESDTVDEQNGTAELERCEGEPEIFIIGGNGTASMLMRRLQREGTPFATGVLHKNDTDHQTAKQLASVLISEEPFEEITDEHIQQAIDAAKKCRKIICTVDHFGKINDKNRLILDVAGER